MSVNLKAQTESPFPMDPDKPEAKWEGVIPVDGVNTDELYKRGLAWMNSFYTNPAGVIKLQDPKGEIEGKARFKLNNKDKKGIVTPSGGFVEYTIHLMFKDGRYRYEITRVHWVTQSYYDVSKWADPKQANYQAETFNFYIEQTNTYVDSLLDSLEDHMKKAPAKEKSDW